MSDWIQVGLGVVGILVAVILFRLERRGSSLMYAVLSSRDIVTKPSAFPLEVRFAGSEIKNPRLVVLRIANAGIKPIEASHFEVPLSINAEGATILIADVTTSRPKSYRPTVFYKDASSVTLEPRLMNSKDMVEVQMLLDGDPSSIDVDGRVAGVPSIDRVKVSRTSWDEPWRVSKADWVILSVPSVSLTAVGLFLLLARSSEWSQYAGVGFVFLGAVLIPWSVWRTTRRNLLFLR